MKNGLIYMALLLMTLSCGKDSNDSFEELENTLYADLNEEAIISMTEKQWNDANFGRLFYNDSMHTTAYASYYQKLDSINFIYEQIYGDLEKKTIQTGQLDDLLRLRFSYKDSKGTYSLPSTNSSWNSLNPKDTVDYRKALDWVNQIRNDSISPYLRQLYLTDLISKFYNYYHYQFVYRPGIARIELLANSEQQVYKRREQAFLIADFYELSDPKNVQVVIGNEVFHPDSVLFHAPTEKGLHEIKGEIHVKESGVEVARPFSYRIWVE